MSPKILKTLEILQVLKTQKKNEIVEILSMIIETNTKIANFLQSLKE